MIQLLAPLLGGLGGLLFPAAGAAASGAAATGIGALLSKAALPALGAGLGTLVSGGGGKDAIRNALLMGVGVTALPGVASSIQQSGFGKSITGGLADIFGAGADLVSGPQQGGLAYSSPPQRPANIASTSGPGIDPASAEPGMERTGTGTPGDRQGPMTTLPSLREMASQGPLFAGARGFESRTGLPPDLDEYLNRMAMQDMSGEAFANAQDMGVEIGRAHV